MEDLKSTDRIGQAVATVEAPRKPVYLAIPEYSKLQLLEREVMKIVRDTQEKLLDILELSQNTLSHIDEFITGENAEDKKFENGLNEKINFFEEKIVLLNQYQYNVYNASKENTMLMIVPVKSMLSLKNKLQKLQQIIGEYPLFIEKKPSPDASGKKSYEKLNSQTFIAQMTEKYQQEILAIRFSALEKYFQNTR